MKGAHLPHLRLRKSKPAQWLESPLLLSLPLSFAFVSPSSAVPAHSLRLWSPGFSCVFSSGPLQSLSGTCCRPEGCLILEAFSDLLLRSLCACAIPICLASSSHRPVLTCVSFCRCFSLHLPSAWVPHLPRPRVQRHTQTHQGCADTAHLTLFRHCPGTP